MVAAHVLPHGAGAVGEVCVVGEGAAVITAGADGRVQVLEPRNGYKPLHTLASHQDCIYSMAAAGTVVLSGDGQVGASAPRMPARTRLECLPAHLECLP